MKPPPDPSPALLLFKNIRGEVIEIHPNQTVASLIAAGFTCFRRPAATARLRKGEYRYEPATTRIKPKK